MGLASVLDQTAFFLLPVWENPISSIIFAPTVATTLTDYSTEPVCRKGTPHAGTYER